jgi:chloramphenicol 3-O phosphotransferase
MTGSGSRPPTDATPPGRIILIDGASSSGKSSIARAVRASIEAPFWRYSIDHLREAGVLPLDRYRSGEFDWLADREAFFDGFHRSIAAFAEAGANLIVEHIVETPAWMERLAGLLSAHDVFFVGVHCSLEELEARERARGDRRIGDARRDFALAHEGRLYDVEIDGAIPPEANAARLITAWRARRRPSAFERMAIAHSEVGKM